MLLLILFLLLYYSCFLQKELQTQVIYTTAFIGALLAYVQLESAEVVEFRFGIILTILMMLLIASPFMSLVRTLYFSFIF